MTTKTVQKIFDGSASSAGTVNIADLESFSSGVLYVHVSALAGTSLDLYLYELDPTSQAVAAQVGLAASVTAVGGVARILASSLPGVLYQFSYTPQSGSATFTATFVAESD